MDYLKGLREQTLGEVASTLATEGTGVGLGFIGANTVGRRIEDWLLKGTVIIPTSTMTEKVKGWAYNNVPKAIMWYVLRRYTEVTPGETLTASKEITVDAKKAIAGSITFDTLLRLVNHGVPLHDPSKWKLLGGSGEETSTNANRQNQSGDIQKLIQENSALRGELNKALQRLASGIQQPWIPPQTVQEPPEAAERRRRFGSMPTEVAQPPIVYDREKKFGFMRNDEGIAKMFGMR